MAQVPLTHGLVLAAILLLLGLTGVLVRRNVVFMLLAIEIMLNAAALAFVVAGARWAEANGQVMFVLVLALTAAEVAVALALVLLVTRQFGTLDADALDEMRG